MNRILVVMMKIPFAKGGENGMSEEMARMDQAMKEMVTREGKYLTFTLANIDKVLSSDDELALLEEAA